MLDPQFLLQEQTKLLIGCVTLDKKLSQWPQLKCHHIKHTKVHLVPSCLLALRKLPNQVLMANSLNQVVPRIDLSKLCSQILPYSNLLLRQTSLETNCLTQMLNR